MEFFTVSIVHTMTRRLLWRWNHVGGWSAIGASGFFLFPAYLVPVRLEALLLTTIILLGYGNMKYLLFVLPFCYES